LRGTVVERIVYAAKLIQGQEYFLRIEIAPSSLFFIHLIIYGCPDLFKLMIEYFAIFARSNRRCLKSSTGAVNGAAFAGFDAS